MKKPKKTKSTKSKHPPRETRTPRPPVPIIASTTATAPVLPTVSPAPPKSPRMPRARLSPAQKMASELTRYLHIHDKHAYGRRGQKAILDLAARVERTAQQESREFAALFRDSSFVDESLRRVRESLEGSAATASEPAN